MKGEAQRLQRTCCVGSESSDESRNGGGGKLTAPFSRPGITHGDHELIYGCSWDVALGTAAEVSSLGGTTDLPKSAGSPWVEPNRILGLSLRSPVSSDNP